MHISPLLNYHQPVIIIFQINEPENHESDRDWGTGFELLKMMRHNNIVNSVCIATRLCNPGYSHIGKKRFTHINDARLQAFKSLTQ